MHLTQRASRRISHDKPSLEFTRYGEDYYLTNVWEGHSHEGVVLPRSNREKELASRFKTVETAGIILQEGRASATK
jgi:hypothetical protein